ncbi:hypothetical protein [Rhodanobacter sp. C05]|uniref:hypothetical protein n=1 Tax=Rhodanobacter sp. C05 TaxID=1945855 RepID=UPI000986617E|nr:hypothetical protein [Rhodanobacter sp. C05]OOG35990.1 hypothetical protein B0E51_18955 [Rhodanobacter sp. C05]
MIHAIWEWVQFNFWFGLLCLAAGMIVTLPLLFSKSLHKRFLRSNYDLETIGVIALVIALFVIGLYNHFGASGA